MGILEAIVQKKNFEKQWLNYILSFEDIEVEKEEYSAVDRDLEAFYSGCNMSTPYLSQADKIKVKRYRRDNCKR